MQPSYLVRHHGVVNFRKSENYTEEITPQNLLATVAVLAIGIAFVVPCNLHFFVLPRIG